MGRFYWQCLKRAFTSGWDAAQAVSLAVGVGAALVISRLPQFRARLEPLAWLLPVGAFAALFLFRFARAPWEIYLEAKNQILAAEQRAEDAVAQLKEHRDCQAIADYLTKEYDYGVHQLLNKPPTKLVDLEEWNRWVENWYTAIIQRMEELGCTAQDLNHVRTIAFVEIENGLPDLPPLAGIVATGAGSVVERINEQYARQAVVIERALQVPVRMHAIRVSRVADVSTRYAERADELKLAATKRHLASRPAD